MLAGWYNRYPDLTTWLKRHHNLRSWRTPLLNRLVSVPNDNRGAYPSRTIAGLLQSIEADAVRWLLAHTGLHLDEPLNAQLVHIMHDEFVWEVPEETAEEALPVARWLMLEALSRVCAACQPRVTFALRQSWAE